LSQGLQQGLRQRCCFNVDGMTTLKALETHFITIANSPTGRRTWRTVTADHPSLEHHRSAHDTLVALKDRTNPTGTASILNAVLTLAVDHELAQHLVVCSFIPWMNQHLNTHKVPNTEREEQLCVLIAAFTEAAVIAGRNGPHLWPATAVIHAAEKPIRAFYRHLTRVAEPIGDDERLIDHEASLVTYRHESTAALSDAELVIQGLTTAVASQAIALEDANLVARVVTAGIPAAHQAREIYLAPRTAQHRVNITAHYLAAHAA
jgi:hypothetical protein